MLKKSKAFTLVELLIVIIIIGILAGMVMLTTGNATDKAEATRIISDMRNIKSACLMYYAEHSTWPRAEQYGDVVDHFLDHSPVMENKDRYSFAEGTQAGSGELYVTITSDTVDWLNANPGVKKQLANMAEEAGIRRTATPGFEQGNIYTEQDTYPFMIVRQ